MSGIDELDRLIRAQTDAVSDQRRRVGEIIELVEELFLVTTPPGNMLSLLQNYDRLIVTEIELHTHVVHLIEIVARTEAPTRLQ